MAKKENKSRSLVLDLTIIVLLYIGFSYVTQRGQEVPVIQNDGYAVSGGIILVFAGYLLAMSVARAPKRGKQSLKQLKEESAKNFEDLGKAAQEISGRKTKKS